VFAAALLAVALLTGAWFAFNALMKVPPDPKVTSVALSRTGRWLAGGTSQGRIAVWDQTANAAPRQITFDEGPLNDLQFNPEETRLVVASHNLATFDLPQPGVPHFLKQDQRHYGTVRYSQDGASVLVITGSSAIELLDAQSGAPRFSVCCSTIYGEVAFTPDGGTVVNAGHWPRLWSARNGQMVGQLLPTQRTHPFRSIAFGDAGATVAMGSQDGRVYVWDVPGRRLAAISEAQPEYVDGVAFTSSGWIVYSASGKTLRLWNPLSGKYRLVEGARPTSNLILNQESGTILFGTAAGAVESWNLETGQRLSARQMPAAQ